MPNVKKVNTITLRLERWVPWIDPNANECSSASNLVQSSWTVGGHWTLWTVDRLQETRKNIDVP